MLEAPIPPLVCSLALPTIVSMLVTSIYNMADTYFVSQINTSASGAVGIVFSIMAIIQAVGFTVGMGAGSTASRLLGKERGEEANTFASTAVFLALVLGLLLSLLGLCRLDGLIWALGSTQTIYPYAREYAGYILVGAPVMVLAFTLNNLLRWQGLANLAVIGLATGGVLNILLDPLFIFGLNMGIGGAGAATCSASASVWPFWPPSFSGAWAPCGYGSGISPESRRCTPPSSSRGCPPSSARGWWGCPPWP